MASSNTGGQSTPSLSELFGSIANAIRLKDGTTADIVANTFPERIRAIQTGIDTSDATAAASDILSGKTAYVDGEKIIGDIPTATISGPGIAVSTTGAITAGIYIGKGYIPEGKNLHETTHLETQEAQTITPGTADKVIAAEKYLTGDQTIKGDANLKAENIKKGVSIFGVSGAYEGATGLVPTTVKIGLSSALMGIMTMAAPQNGADISYFSSIANGYVGTFVYFDSVTEIPTVVGSILYLFTSNYVAQLQNAIELKNGDGGIYPSANDHYIMITGPNAVIAFDPV